MLGCNYAEGVKSKSPGLPSLRGYPGYERGARQPCKGLTPCAHGFVRGSERYQACHHESSGEPTPHCSPKPERLECRRNWRELRQASPKNISEKFNPAGIGIAMSREFPRTLLIAHVPCAERRTAALRTRSQTLAGLAPAARIPRVASQARQPWAF